MGLRTTLALTAACLFVAACSERTEIVVAVDTDMVVPDEIDRVRFEVIGPSGGVERAEADLTSTTLPVTLGLVHEGGALAPLTVDVIGQRGDAEVVRRQARTAFLEGKTLLLHVGLLGSCRGVECPEGQTCGSSGCEAATVNPGDLPEWSGRPPRMDGGGGVVDGGGMDAGGSDAGGVDAGGVDAGGVDAGGVDAGPGDAGTDAGDPCADCDDGVDCTAESCDAIGGCVSTADHTLCPLGQLCDGTAGGCVAAATFTEIYAIFTAECSPCHTNAPFSGELNFSSQDLAYADLVGVAAICGTGNVRVIPDDARNSLLWRKLAAVDLCGNRMPNGRTGLPMEQIDAVRDWINAGAADN